MSREELMKHIKKQTALLQKMKIRTDREYYHHCTSLTLATVV